MLYTNTVPKPGDLEINLLGKILQRLNGIAMPGDSDAVLLAKILLQLNGVGGGGGGGSTTFIGLTDVPANFTGAAGKEVFVNAGGTALEFVGPYFTKVGTAYVGGDQTGNVRGAKAIDVQSRRTAVTQVASGAGSNVFGYRSTASGAYATALGSVQTASGYISVAVGYNNTASGGFSMGMGEANTASGSPSVAVGGNNTASFIHTSAVGDTNIASFTNGSAFGYKNTASTAINASAFGNQNSATGAGASAFGYKAVARIAKTTNINGPQIIRKDNSEGLALAFESFCGTRVVLTSPEVNLKTVADYVITLPAGCHFYPRQVGVVVTSAAATTIQPTIRFGNTGTPAKFLAATITTTAAVQFDSQEFNTLLSQAGEVTVSAGVTIAATATTLLGRFYWTGLLVEDE